jgi:predicted molibdopterin-dependent oxidoreductase YjgC
MVEFTAQQEPVHHITVTQGSQRAHFWYFLATSNAKVFDKTKDQKLVEMLYEKGAKLEMGAHVLLTSENGDQYNVGRMDATNYSVQSLSTT